MEVKVVDDKTSINKYVKFCKDIYKDNIYYRDIMSPTLKSILLGKAEICKSSIIKPILISDSGEIVMVCTFAIVDRMKDTLQIAYFEALENQEEALEIMMTYGRKMAEEHGIKKILIGLNFHVNYGLGLLANNFQEVQTFGGAYNPPYYIEYFKKYAHEEINLVSYIGNVKDFDFGVKERLMKKVTAKYTVRKADFNQIKREAELYTNINNEAFKQHKFYYERRLEEDLELFNDFKLLLKEENLLFVEDEGNPIGFMLWYPDFNELIKPNETMGSKTIIWNKLFSHKIQRFKIVELGVVPAYQKTGAVLALFNHCWQIVKDKYQYCESGWILEENYASKGFGLRWGDKEYKEYKVFLIHL